MNPNPLVASSNLRFTSSYLRVTSLKAQVRKLKARVARFEARVKAIKPRVKWKFRVQNIAMSLEGNGSQIRKVSRFGPESN